jgi:hypothetical protein
MRPTRFKTGEPVHDTPGLPEWTFFGLPEDVEITDDCPCIAVIHRVGPSVYWGPFPSLAALGVWADRHDMRVGVILLKDPDSDPGTWWYP